MLSEGDKAPLFELESDSGKRVSLKEALGQVGDGKLLVLYFYPKDNTPGCTREAQSFAEGKRKLGAAGATVIGVSKDSIKSHCGFRDKYELNFPLLSDPDLAVHRAYGAYGEKTMYGKKVMGTIRSTFLIAGPAPGKIVKVWSGVKVDGHTDKVLEAVRAARGEGGDGAIAKSAEKSAKKSSGTGPKKSAKKP
jgi:peroxiredoxin Q/BCP